MVVISDMAEYERVLVDGLKNFPRVLMPLRRLTLTKLRLPLLRGARTGTIAKAAKAYDLDNKWVATPAYNKMNRYTLRSQTTDLDRFRIMINRKNRAQNVRKLAFKIRSKK